MWNMICCLRLLLVIAILLSWMHWRLCFLFQQTCYVCSTLQRMSAQNAKSTWIRLKNGKISWMLGNFLYNPQMNSHIMNAWETLQIIAHVIKYLLTMSKIHGWRLYISICYIIGLKVNMRDWRGCFVIT